MSAAVHASVIVLLTLSIIPVDALKIGRRNLRGHHYEQMEDFRDKEKMIVVRNYEEMNATANNGGSGQAAPGLTFNDVYSEWSAWKRCNRRCKQVRTRVCKVNEVCGTTILKEERGCTGDKCPLSTPSDLDQQVDQQQQQVQGNGNKGGRKRQRNFRVLYHLQNMIYSEWSEWSPCTSHCRTRRYRVCELHQVCGNSMMKEDALCYNEGSTCEQRYKKKRRRTEGGNGVDVDAEAADWQNRTHLIDDANCGKPQVTNMAAQLRIIGGREATKGAWPWQLVVLNQHHEPFCGGTLITPQFVLTAAHCVRRRLFVRAGEHDVKEEDGDEQTVRVDRAYTHPDYDIETVRNDIALLKLKKPMKMTRVVSSVCLPATSDELEVESLGTVLGWGKKRKGDRSGADTLMEAEVPIASIEECKKQYDDFLITDNMVCAGYKRGKIDSCAGDSGGPLLTQRDDQWFVYGVTSFGEGCGRKGKFGIYTKVPDYVSWIRETIQKFST
ncbi:Coagulation factor X [Halotydeus destructor]|nr:Coagulation factor X [Halotydeus destructor]